jgi:hypothetical protein
MHPYPAVVNPILSRYSDTPASSRYFVTTPDPGESEVLRYAGVVSPLLTAFLASIPA